MQEPGSLRLFNSTSFRFVRIGSVLFVAGLFLNAGQLQAQKVAPYLRNTNYIIQLGMYNLFTSTQAGIVMLGNSLTYNANWNEILNRSNIANRGIALVSKNGFLRADLTYDGIHLNAKGYALWAPQVESVLAKHKL